MIQLSDYIGSISVYISRQNKTVQYFSFYIVDNREDIKQHILYIHIFLFHSFCATKNFKFNKWKIN
jgi:hypothetical protein